MSYVPTTSSAQSLPDFKNWIAGELVRISNSFTTSKQALNIPVINAAPAKPQVGDVVFADGTNWNPSGGRGLYYYDTSWVKIAQVQIMGFSFSKNNSNNQSSSNADTFVDPNQSPYLQDIYGQAQQLNSQGMPVEGVAGINGMLGNALGTAYGVGSNMVAGGANASQGTNMALNYAGGAMGGNAQGGINTAMGAGQGMANLTGMMGAANNNGFNQAKVDSAMAAAMPGLQNQITGATRDIFRDLQENQLTGIGSQAAGSGNSGSSRAGMMEGIATRGAMDRSSDVAANIFQNANNMYTGMEANRAAQNAGFQQQANQSNQSAYNNMLQYGTGMGQNAYNTNQQNQQFGASMAQQLGQQGYNNMMAGVGMQQGAGQYIRDYDQQLLNNQYQQAMSPFNSLNFYNQIVGAPNNLSSASSSSSGSSSGSSVGFG